MRHLSLFFHPCSFLQRTNENEWEISFLVRLCRPVSCELVSHRLRMKDIPLPPLSRSHIFGRRAARWMSLRSPPSAPLPLPLCILVDLFILKFKQLEAQLALPLGVVNRCVHRRELSRVFSALGKPVSGSGSHSRVLQIKERFRLMDRRPFSDDCEDVWLLIPIMGIFRRGGVTW